ncbi:MAG: KH domain-containing protein [Desulfobacteraceae bacterium]|nr:MAG: KH domain-containing protein [Desulfobacteraceae bacterium]
MRTSSNLIRPDNGGFSIKEVVEIIARALVDQPEAVFVSEISSAHSLIVELKVAKEDLGKIIGKQGRNAGAIRTIVNAVSARTRKHTVLEIIEYP